MSADREPTVNVPTECIKSGRRAYKNPLFFSEIYDDLCYFSLFYPQLQGKCQGITRKDGARPALFPLGDKFYTVSSSLILV